MVLANYIALISIGIYSFLILYFSYGWKKLKSTSMQGNYDAIMVSVVVACRNEENNILKLLESLKKQTYPKEKTEIILINDHSSDDTENIILEFIKYDSRFRLLNLPENKTRKKQALTVGIKESVSEIILTTDADCIVHTRWLESMVQYYMQNKPMLLVGPVGFVSSQKLFHKMQALEFMSLVGSGAGAIGINRAIMCNGANLLFEKSIYEKCNTQNNLASGDDIFLLLHVKKINTKRIHFIKSKDTIVFTNPANSLKDFFNQRIRWTSKSKAYRDFDLIFTSIVVALANLILISTLIFSFWEWSNIAIFIAVFSIKSIVDLFILIPVLGFFRQRKLLWLFLPLQIIYPFYIVLTLILGLIGNFHWKARSFHEKR